MLGTEPRVLAGLLRKGNGGARRKTERKKETNNEKGHEGGKEGGGGSKKASLVGAPSAVRRLQRGGGGGEEGKTRWPEEVRPRESERSDETKEEGRPMLGDKSRLTSRERGL